MKTKIHKVSLDDVFKQDYRLLSIFTEEPDYRVAFLFNYFLSFDLVRSNSINYSKTKTKFSVYEYEDEDFYRDFKLIANQQIIYQKNVINSGLFSDLEAVVEKKVYYLKELSQTNFFLKITADEPESYYDDLLESIKNIPQIYTATYESLEMIKNQKLLKI